MFRNYLKIALRHFRKQKSFTAINILGLSVGIACCLFIVLFIRHNLEYDRYHRDLDRIYLLTISDAVNEPDRCNAKTCYPSGEVLRTDFPQVEKVASVLEANDALVKRGERVFYEKHRMFTESSLFDILTIPFIKGDPAGALDRPFTTVITESIAEKYFPGEDPLGQSIEINRRDYEVTGIVADAPGRTHFKYDIFASFRTVEKNYPVDAWFLCNILNYVKLRPGVERSSLTGRLSTIDEIYSGQDLAASNEDYFYDLSPVRGIHLNSSMDAKPEPGINPMYIYYLAAIGAFILLIACVNFININTARSAKRAREVGIRKVAGASRAQLVRQYLGESVLMAIVALGIALMTADAALPYFSGVSGIDITKSDIFTPGTLIVMAGLVVFIGLIAGFYPAFLLSSFRPAETLKQSSLSGPRGGTLRRILVIGQFALAAILIAGTTVISRQLDFMKEKDLGFASEQQVIVPLRYPVRVTEGSEEFKQEFLTHSSIKRAALSNIVPGETKAYFTTLIKGGEKDGKSADIYFNFIDPDFPEVYGLELAAGRLMDYSWKTDMDSAYVINMTAVKKYGFTSPEQAIGAQLEWGPNRGEVIGVVEDFHFMGLQQPVGPLCLIWRRDYGSLTLTVEPSQMGESLAFIESTFRNRFPGMPYDYYFLDERFNMQYNAVERISRLFGGFSTIGLVVACLGLFGLAIFMAEQKRKEVGIRKVLGASTGGIVILLAQNFLKWVVTANIIAWPISYLIMRRWLENFPYRAHIGIPVFVAALVITITVALCAVGSVVIKSARTSPVEAIRC